MMFDLMSGFDCRRILVLLVLGLCGAGCAGGESGPERYDVSGMVTFNGLPVPHGDIQFIPDTRKGNSGPAGFATIVNGKFSTAEKGRGTVGGPHEMVINGTAETPSTDEESPPGAGPLFPEYRSARDLPKQATTLEVQVPMRSAS